MGDESEKVGFEQTQIGLMTRFQNLANSLHCNTSSIVSRTTRPPTRVTGDFSEQYSGPVSDVNRTKELVRAPFRTNPAFAVVERLLGFSIVRPETLEGSGARTIEGVEGTDTGAVVRISRFRLRYSRIQAALCAGSR